MLTDVPSTLDWSYDVHLKNHGKWDGCARGKTLGGSAAVNAQMWVLGDPKDWDTIGDRQWSWTKIAPLYRWLFDKFETRLVSNGNRTLLAMMKSFKPCQVVEDHNETIIAAQDSKGLISFCRQNNSTSERANPFTVLIEPLVAAGKVTVVDAATVERVVINESKEAVGVVFSVPCSGAHFVGAREDVVLCAGAFNTPQILMLSGIGPSAELARHSIPCVADLPVGEGLVDHAFSITSAQLKVPGERSNGSFLDTAGFWKTEWSQKNEPQRGRDMQVCMYSAPPRDFGLRVGVRRIVTKLFAHGPRDSLRGRLHFFCIQVLSALFDVTKLADSKLDRSIAIGAVLNHPRSRGTLKLSSADPHAAPVIDLGLLTAPEDIQRLVEATRAMLACYKTEPLKSLVDSLDPVCAHLEGASDEVVANFIKAEGSHAWHPVATAALGRVVDSSLRVLGVKKLRVADCSVLPDVPSGNTMVPAFLVGANAAEIIGAELDPK